MQKIPVHGMIPSASRFHIPEVLLQTTRQIPRHGAWTQIVTLDTGKIVTECVAELAGEIRPDIASGGIGRVESRRRFVRSKRVRQHALPDSFPHLSFSPLPGKGRQAERQRHEEQDGQGVGIVAAGAEEVSEVAVKLRSPETLRTDGTGIVFDLETVGIHPADGAFGRNQHIAGMQITKDHTVTVQRMDGFRQVQAQPGQIVTGP